MQKNIDSLSLYIYYSVITSKGKALIIFINVGRNKYRGNTLRIRSELLLLLNYDKYS